MSKGKPEWACQVAQQAVDSAPSEFLTWAKLAETYIELGQFDKALLNLNSCPMFTFNERDLHRMPTPARTHLPVKKFISDANLFDEESARDNEADVALLRLPAPGLRGTFAKAYHLLTLLVAKIGWDELLKTRSAVFVMEEEYRQHKTSGSVDTTATMLASAGKREENGHAESDENASTRAIHSPVPSDHESEEASPADEHGVNGEQLVQKEAGEKQGQDQMPPTTPSIEKPESLAHAPESGDKEDDNAEASFQNSNFSNKRLCERWLGEWQRCVG
jgi:hypothetical protein